MPYPSMATFDSPSREFCVSRRIRTNTPLLALGRRMAGESAPDEQLELGWHSCRKLHPTNSTPCVHSTTMCLTTTRVHPMAQRP